MDLNTIAMPREQAAQAFSEYRRAVEHRRRQELTGARRTVRAIRDRHRVEDEQIMVGYQALAEGHQVIDLRLTMQSAGLVDVPRRAQRPAQLPRLAVCRADAEVCYCDVSWHGGVAFCADKPTRGRPRISSGVTADYVVFPDGTFPEGNNPSARAIVPIIPPQFRPGRGLGRLHVLWEAEWTLTAPLDPALLRHLGGDLWVVLATWDLTELERTVLMGRVRDGG